MNQLDKFTVGSTPASIYLIDVLNEIQSSKLTRKVLNIIKQISDKFNALERAHDAGVMNTHICASLANTILQEMDHTSQIFTNDIVNYMIANVDAYDDKLVLVKNLMDNVLRGKYKSLISRLMSINKIEKAQKQIKTETNFVVKNGIILAISKIALIKRSVMDETESVTPTTLAEKSWARLQRASERRKNAKMSTV